MTFEQANEQIIKFFAGRELTFCIERCGENGEEWIVRCNEIPAISTSGYGFDERDIKEQTKDAILSCAGVDGSFADSLLKELTFTSQFAVAA